MLETREISTGEETRIAVRERADMRPPSHAPRTLLWKQEERGNKASSFGSQFNKVCEYFLFVHPFDAYSV